jgi:hypothetical protein
MVSTEFLAICEQVRAPGFLWSLTRVAVIWLGRSYAAFFEGMSCVMLLFLR